jgi:hypothetical protein
MRWQARQEQARLKKKGCNKKGWIKKGRSKQGRKQARWALGDQASKAGQAMNELRLARAICLSKQEQGRGKQGEWAEVDQGEQEQGMLAEQAK